MTLKNIFRWLREKYLILIGVLAFLILISFAFWLGGKGIIEKIQLPKNLTKEENQQIEVMREKLKAVKGDELLEMRDGSLLFVRMVAQDTILVKTLYGEAYERPLWAKWFPYEVVRIISPSDPDYPEMAKKFLLQDK